MLNVEDDKVETKTDEVETKTDKVETKTDEVETKTDEVISDGTEEAINQLALLNEKVDNLNKALTDKDTTISDLTTQLETASRTIGDFRDKLYGSDDLQNSDTTVMTLEQMIRQPNVLRTRYEKNEGVK